MHDTEEPSAAQDVALIARCRDGDGKAWRLLVERYQRLVYAVARRGGLDEHAAADVFQAVFSRLLEALPRVQQPERIRAWIVTTAKRETLLQLRRVRHNVTLAGAAEAEPGQLLLDDIADPSALPEQQLDELQQLLLLRLALDRLDARCRDLLKLLFADDDERLPYEQIALRLQMPIGSIGPTRLRCLSKLRSLLQQLEAS